MSYLVRLGTDASRSLAKLPQPIQRRVGDELRVLAASPSKAVTRSRAGHAKGQWFQSSFRYDDMTFLLDVVFQFSQDESALEILQIYVESSE